MNLTSRFNSHGEIRPEKITKPFQLLATWLLGLVILVGEFVFASMKTYEIKWISGLYAINSVVIVPIFLTLIFLLQTKYRPQMQEDKYYSNYLRDLKSELDLKTYPYDTIRLDDE